VSGKLAVSCGLPCAFAVGGLMTVASLAVLASREVALGRDQLVAAEVDAAHGDWADAISHARSAAEARAPGSPWPARAARRLDELAHQAELRGDDDTALVAYGALRAAALSTRSIGASQSAWLAAAADGVARIAARRDAAGAGRVGDSHDHASSIRETLRREDSPLTWTFAALALAAFALVGGLSILALSGHRRKWTHAARALCVGGLLIYAAVLLMN
jgi:hypothetical protein